MKLGNSSWLSAGLRLLGILVASLLVAGAATAEDLGSGALQIAGSRLVISPVEQTVPFDTPTLIETSLDGYDVGLGTLPQDLVVVGELSGPEISGVLRLETLPNEPFRIPRLRLKGLYTLQDIRLEQDGQLLAYAEPRQASVLVTRILVTSVSAAAMSEDEMRSYGIVVGDDSHQAFNLTFGFGVKNGELARYTMPVVYRLYGDGGNDGSSEPRISIPAFETDNRTAAPRFFLPKLTPFKVDLEPQDRQQVQVPKGGCDLRTVPCRTDEPPAPPMIGVIMFPSDISLLHQFFSVVLMVQNGAPSGDVLSVRDLTAKARLPSGLRAVETDPPTPLGVPVPVRAPGPDGEVGTADDLHLLVAQATGEAEFLVEGLQQGSHVVEFDLRGVLEGMPGGPRPITGQAKGAVVVRDPTLAVSLAHPEVVRANEAYSLFVTLSNLGNAPVSDIDFNLPASGLAGVELAAGQGPSEQVGSLLPGEAATVEFRLLPQLTGRVIASAAKSGSALQPSFDFELGISNGVPLSPLSLAMPQVVESLPPALHTEALGLLGLGHSLSTATPGVAPEAPRVQRQTVHERVYQLVQAARHIALGEDEFDALAVLAAEWLGSRNDAWEWDRMRRSTDRGLGMTVELAEVFAAQPTLDAFERIAALTSYLDPQLVAAYGTGVRLELQSRTSGKRSDDTAAARELPFVDLLPLDDGTVAMAAVPEPGGYRAVVRRDNSGSFGLRILLPATGTDDMTVLSWTAVALGTGEQAWVDFDLVDENLVLEIDQDGDGVADSSLPAVVETLSPRPFEVVAARQNEAIDPSGHVVEVLLSSEIDLQSLIPRESSRFAMAGKVSNGGITPIEQNIGGNTAGQEFIENPFEGLFNPRVVRVVFDNPISPLVDVSQHLLTVSDLIDVQGRDLGSSSVTVEVTVDQPGIQLEGQVIDPYGQPLPFAEVALRQWDRVGVEGVAVECRGHRTAAVRADAEGRFHFDYVRQTSCSDRFELLASSSYGPHRGRASGKVRFVGSTQELNVVMVGRGVLSGRVLYDDGTVPSGLQVFAYNPVFDAGRRAWVGEQGEFRMAEVAVGTVTLWAQDDQGNRVYQTLEVPTAGAEVERDLVMLRRPDAATARLSGRATDFATGEPEVGAYIALYVDGARVNVARSDAEGLFDFGVVPTGVAEIEAFDGVSGRRGTQLFFELDADEVEYVELQLRDDRGDVEGYVRRRLVDGSVVAVPGAVVWAEGTPFNTTTDEQGFFTLEDVFPGTRRIKAADLEAGEITEVYVTVAAGVTQTANLYFEDEFEVAGGLYGTVLDGDGQPVDNARVHLAGGYWSTRWHHEAFTDGDGRFHIAELEPGVYGVHAMSGNDGGVAFGEIRFPGDTDDVTVRLDRSKIRGRTFVIDEQGYVQGVKSTLTYRHVEVVHQWGLVVVAPDFSYGETDDDGYFEIEALHGPYELHVYNPFYDTGYRRIAGQLGAIEPDHQIEFKQNGSISGFVWQQDGETPAVGASVKLRGGAFDDYDLETDEEGRFSFELVPPGRYHVTATLDEGVHFRQERVYVQMRRHGAEMEVEVRLQAQGRIEGYVIDAGGEFVPGAVVELRERGFPWRRLVHNADDDGQYSFDNVFEGELTLRAKAPELGGLAGHECAEITFEGELVNVEIQLEGTGDLSGQVIHPGTGEGVANARVAVHHAGFGFVDSTHTDSDGYFEVRSLKLRPYRLRVFDPATGRRGISNVFEIESHGQEVEQDVVLEVRGEVQGHLYDPDAGNQGVPGATLQLHSQGIRWFKTYSSTGIDGDYSFEGIPEGPFDITTYRNRRRASGSGEIEEEDQLIELDLYLERQSRLFGRVLGPRRFEGDPGEVFENVNITLREISGFVGATTDNPFDFEDLRPREYHKLVAREINGGHKATYEFRLGQGEDREKDVRMRAIGTARIRVLDSTGDPVTGAQVHVTNSYTYSQGAASDQWFGLSHKLHDANTGDDHEVVFTTIRQGFVEARVEDPLTGLKGRKVGLLEWQDQELLVEVRLQANGWVRGQVLLPDGVTPAAFAVLALDAPGRSWQLQEADEQGNFEFEAVPLGDYTLIAQQADGPGTYEVRSNLGADQEIDEYTLTLDDADPYVVSVDPPFDSRDTARDLDIVVTFSEPIRSCGGGCASHAYLQRISSSEKPAIDHIWSADRTVLTLRPTALLRNHTGYKVVIGTGLQDDARRGLAWRVVSSFYTADTVAPKVIDVRPKRDAVQVPVDSSLEITFSEPFDLDSLSGAFTVLDTTAGGALTVTTLTSLDDRRVILTPVTDLATDRLIEVRVEGVADGAGNVMTTPFLWSFNTPDATPPQISWTSPSSGQLFTAGEAMQVSADITDNRGMERVVFSLREWSKELTGGPYEWRIPAPVMEQAGPVLIAVEATDIYGNVAVSTLTVQVEPLDNAVPPQLSAGCPADGDLVAPGVAQPVTFAVGDDLGVESAWLLIDGLRVDQETPVDAESANIELTWTPPEGAPPGQSFQAILETRDFAGNITSVPMAFAVPGSELLVGDQAVTSSGDLALAAGVFDLAQTADLGELVLLTGATLAAADGAELRASSLRLQCGAEARLDDVTLTGDATVERGSVLGPRRLRTLDLLAVDVVIEEGAEIDGRKKGYYGQDGGTPYVPAGRTGPQRAGGSHGGTGSATNVAAEAFDSVYAPLMHGGGGGESPHTYSTPGGDGGGVVWIEASGTVVLDGLIDVGGEPGKGDPRSGGGAGGSLRLAAQRLEGGGTILASGGGDTCDPGGGGRLALSVAELLFDVEAQIENLGGVDPCGTALVGERIAGPGTTLIETAGSVYGTLIVDGGELPAEIEEQEAAWLTPLGELPVSATQIDGQDLWLFTGAQHLEAWLGAFAVLENSIGAELGTFRVLEVDTDRLLLAGGAGVSAGVTTARGLYRFDRIELSSARLRATDPFELDHLQVDGSVTLDEDFEAVSLSLAPSSEVWVRGSLKTQTLEVGADARVRPDQRPDLDIEVTGVMTVAAGAVLLADGKGHGGGETSTGLRGRAPEGVLGSKEGGSHGGLGHTGSDPGESFGSVYRPSSSGGGGGSHEQQYTSTRIGGSGGGRLDIRAGELVLGGTLRANGAMGPYGYRGGAGGSVSLEVGTLSGAGGIEVVGGAGEYSGGGGGRVAILVETFDGFDPSLQVTAAGGLDTGSSPGRGGPGTIFIHTAASTFGDLYVDGEEAGGLSVGDTPLPRLGVWTVGSVTADAQSPADAWVEPAAPGSVFSLGIEGMWARVDGVDYRVLADDGSRRRLLLEDAAGAVVPGQSLEGVYKFDDVTIAGGAILGVDDRFEAARVSSMGGGVLAAQNHELGRVEVPVGSVLELDGPLRAGEVVIGGIVRTDADLAVLEIEADRLVVEAGARIDHSGRGFRGGPGPDGEDLRGLVPAGVSGSMRGGSHGGQGHSGSDHGEPFGSVYRPRFGGGGGGSYRETLNTHTFVGGRGGGVIEIRATEMVIDGEIRSDGWQGEQGDRGGAGGTIYAEIGHLSGSGLIVARGSGGDESAGGGGRVALYADLIVGFDPQQQVSAAGGEDLGLNGDDDTARGGAGTVFVYSLASTYGDLYVDGDETGGLDTDRTILPRFGQQVIGVAEPDTGDPNHLWIEPQDPQAVFDLGVEGMWARVDGADYRVLAEAGDRRRILLEGAAGLVGIGDTATGVYKFDRVVLAGAARLESIDSLEATVLDSLGSTSLDAISEIGTFTVAGGSRVLVSEPLRSDSLVVEDGGEMLGVGEILRLEIETLHVATGAVIQVDGLGYAGGVDGTPAKPGSAPAGVPGSAEGGVHGGNGDGSDATGATFGSVYRPRYGGGGGGAQERSPNFDWHGGDGGGVLEIYAGSATIDGTLRANGQESYGDLRGGAGGTVYLEAATLSGTGTFEARGAGGDASSGGGGRIALLVDDLQIDPASQTYADSFGQGGAGTVYVRSQSSTWGDLYVDARSPSQQPALTRLPMIDENEIAAVTVDTDDPADLWVETVPSGADPSLGVEGMWALVRGAEYRVLRDGARRHFLLEGAAGFVQPGMMIEGLYRFDSVHVSGGSRLRAADEIEAGAWLVDGVSEAEVDQVGPGGPNCGSGNLLHNPGGDEALHADGSIPGWVQLKGQWKITGSLGFEPEDGANYLWADDPFVGDRAELYQDVDLSAWAAEIDAGLGQGFFAGSLVANSNDPARFLVEYQDAAGTVLESFDSGERLESFWHRITDLRSLPPSARTARIRLLGRDVGAFVQIWAGFDAMRFHFLPVPSLVISGDSSLAETEDEASYQLTLACPLPAIAEVSYQAVGLSAQVGSDFVASSGTVSFAPGETQKTLAVALLDDLDTEGDESFELQVTSSDVGLLAPSFETVIVDDELGGLVLELSDTFDAGGLSVGAEVSYTASLTFDGSVTLANARITGIMAGELSIIEGSVTTSLGSVQSSQPLDVALGDLAPQASVTLTFRARLDAYPAGDVVTGQLVLGADGIQDLLSDDPATAPADATATPISPAPAITSVVAGGAQEGRPVTLTADFEDPTAGDSHTATVDWGDGTAVEAVAVTPMTGGGSLEARHVYAQDGGYLATVCVTDALDAEVCAELTLEVANSAPRLGAVDFTGFLAETVPTESGSLQQPDWQIEPGGRLVSQPHDNYPSVFYGEHEALGLRWRGRIRMPGSDNDHVGFVLGFEPGDSQAAGADYLLVRWKRTTESSLKGLRLFRIRGAADLASLDSAPEAELLALGSTLGTAGWSNNRDYVVEIEAEQDRLRLWVDGGLEFDVAADPGDPFSTGRFGLFSFGQEGLVYRDWTRTPAAVDAANAWVAPGVELTDFTAWSGDNLPSGSSLNPCDFEVSSTGLSVTQNVNCRPGVFFSDQDLVAGRVDGIVTFLGDDDVAGFIFGYRSQAEASAEHQYLNATWRGTDGDSGLKLYRQPVLDPAASGTPIAVGMTRGSTPWTADVDYHVSAEFRPDRFRLWIDGALELDVEAGAEPFEVGRWGFYVSAQAGVRFRGFEHQHALTLAEGDTTPDLYAAFGDAGRLDSHTATVDWGDGTALEAVTVDAAGGAGSLTAAPHLFADEILAEAELCVTDDGGAGACLGVPVHVRNLPPVVDAGADLVSSGTADLDGAAFSDAGVLDSHTATIDWGDGTFEAATVTETAGSGTLDGSHTYLVTGSYEVTVCVIDDGGAAACDTAQATVDVGTAQLQATKTATLIVDRDSDGEVSPGDDLRYDLVVSSTGSAAAVDLLVRDTIPASTTLVAGSLTTSGGTAVEGDPVEVSLAQLDPGTQLAVSFEVTLAADLPASVTEVVNQAEVMATALATVLTDDPAEAGAADPTVTAVLAPPKDLVITLPATTEGEPVTLEASFTDVNADDIHDATIDWGDGSGIEVVTVQQVAGGGSLEAPHLYPQDGSFTATVCVADSSSNETCTGAVASVGNQAPRLGQVDFNRWTAEIYPSTVSGTTYPPDFRLVGDGSQVDQVANNYATVLYTEHRGLDMRWRGRLRMGDDDAVGFVVGFEPGDATSSSADYLLFYWKDVTHGTWLKGLRLYRVRGVPASLKDFTIAPEAELLASANNWANTGYSQNRDYQLELEVSDQRARLWVDGVLEIDVTADPGDPFAAGRFGLFSYAQSGVLAREWSRQPGVDQPAGTQALPAIEVTDLATFSGENLPSGSGLNSAVWQVSSTGASVTQNVNCRPGVFYSDEDMAAGRLSGVVTFTGDNDTAGFVFGYRPQAEVSAQDSYLRLFWNGSDSASQNGLWLYRYQDSVGQLVANGANWGSTAWSTNVDYHLGVELRPDRFRAWIDGELEFDVDLSSEPLEAGRWGFYASAQAGVRYRGFEEQRGLELVAGESTPSLALSFGDAGVLDTHTATVDWGDGSAAESGTVTQGPGVGSVVFDPHLALGEGLSIAELCVVDDAGGSQCLEVPVEVSSASSLTADPDPESSVAEGLEKPAPAPELGLTLEAALEDDDGDRLASPGETIEYTLVVRNLGSHVARSVAVLDELPDGVHMVPGSLVADRGEAFLEQGAVVFELGDLWPGESVTASFKVWLGEVLPAGATELTNRAVCSAIGLEVTTSDDPSTPRRGDATRLSLAKSSPSP